MQIQLYMTAVAQNLKRCVDRFFCALEIVGARLRALDAETWRREQHHTMIPDGSQSAVIGTARVCSGKRGTFSATISLLELLVRDETYHILHRAWFGVPYRFEIYGRKQIYASEPSRRELQL